MTSDLAKEATPFKPKARILRTIGEELISNEVVAVIELVKNAYDADAHRVLVRFSPETTSLGQGVIEVIDDGHGMALDTVQNAWMEPATNHKKKAGATRRLSRRFLGEKGVGRFASARLAKELELITREEGSPNETYAYFDWTQFDDQDRYLEDVLILAEQRPAAEILDQGALEPYRDDELPVDQNLHGTILRMSGVKRAWDKAQLDALTHGLSRLISPFSKDKSFRILLQRPDEDHGQAQQISPPEVIKYPHYKVRGAIDASGKYEFRATLYQTGQEFLQTGRLSRSFVPKPRILNSTNDDSDAEVGQPLQCGPIKFEFLAWDRDELDNITQKIGTGIRSIRRDIDSISGISIYRDDFRVMPYGEPSNDWLRLDLRRVQNPKMRFSNNQITGYIEIGSLSNPLLVDQSNREGLDNNQALSDLQDVTLEILSYLEGLRRQQKKDEKSPSARPTPSGEGLFDPVDVSELEKELQERFGEADPTFVKFIESTRKWQSKLAGARETLSRYHSLATLGQLVDKLVHDGRQPLGTVQGQTALAAEALQYMAMTSSAQSEEFPPVLARLARVSDSASILDALFRRIEPLGGRKRGHPTKLYVEEIVRSAFAHFESEIQANGVTVSLPETSTLARVDSAEIQEVLINLISNSMYWLQTMPSGKRAIIVGVSRLGEDELEILFSDSGPGVPKQNATSIFDPYFSTKPNGMGMGLVIAGEIARDYYKGDLELIESGPLKGATFRIVLRKRIQ